MATAQNTVWLQTARLEYSQAVAQPGWNTVWLEHSQGRAQPSWGTVSLSTSSILSHLISILETVDTVMLMKADPQSLCKVKKNRKKSKFQP